MWIASVVRLSKVCNLCLLEVCIVTVVNILLLSVLLINADLVLEVTNEFDRC